MQAAAPAPQSHIQVEVSHPCTADFDQHRGFGVGEGRWGGGDGTGCGEVAQDAGRWAAQGKGTNISCG